MNAFLKSLGDPKFLSDPGVIAGVVLVILLWSILSVVILAISLAKKGVMFTYMKEGTAKAILRGEEFDGIIMSWAGHHINEPGSDWHNHNRPDWEVLLNKTRDTPDANPNWSMSKWNQGRSFLEKKFGIYWVGLPFIKKLYSYKFEWTEEKQGESGERVPWVREQMTDFIYVSDFSYHITQKSAETSDNLPVDIQYLLTIRVNNPRKAFFDTDDWLKRITGLTNAEVRNYAGSMSFEELTSEKHKRELKKTEIRLITSILDLNKKLPASEDPKIHQLQSNGEEVSLPSLYGVTIIGADVQSIDPSGEIGEKARAALTALYEAERAGKALEATAVSEKNAMITRADGEKDAMIKRAEGQKDAYDKISSTADGLALRQLEVLESIGEKGNMIIVDGKTNLLLDPQQKTRMVKDK